MNKATNRLRSAPAPADDPFTKISKPDAPTEPVADPFLSEEEALRQQADALETKRIELEDRRKKAADEANARKLQTLEDLKEDAANFRASARTETDETSKKAYLRWAADAEKQAMELARELGISQLDAEWPETEAAPDAAPNRIGHKRRAFGQIGLLLFAIMAFYSCFLGVGEDIKKTNDATLKAAKLAEARGVDIGTVELMKPYDDTSLQKFLLEKFWGLSDYPFLLLALFIFAPFVLGYLFPFWKSKKDFLTEFFTELTAYERCKVALFLLATLLLHLALVHSVKP